MRGRVIGFNLRTRKGVIEREDGELLAVEAEFLETDSMVTGTLDQDCSIIKDSLFRPYRIRVHAVGLSIGSARRWLEP